MTKSMRKQRHISAQTTGMELKSHKKTFLKEKLEVRTLDNFILSSFRQIKYFNIQFPYLIAQNLLIIILSNINLHSYDTCMLSKI